MIPREYQAQYNTKPADDLEVYYKWEGFDPLYIKSCSKTEEKPQKTKKIRETVGKAFTKWVNNKLVGLFSYR